MSTSRKFKFPLSVLNRAAGLLQAALGDPAYAPAMTRRLGAGFAATYAAQIAAVPGAGKKQTDQTVTLADLTDEQEEALAEVERLTAGARRSARLAFPGEATRLREEFQVGVDTPKTLAAVLERARKVHAATLKYATELAAHGWLAEDATALGEALALLAGKDLAQEGALDTRLTLTDEKTAAANALYLATLSIQNAARLEYPAKRDRATGQELHATARARFLLDEYPPRDRSEPDGGTQGGGTPPTA